MGRPIGMATPTVEELEAENEKLLADNNRLRKEQQHMVRLAGKALRELHNIVDRD